MMNQIFAIKPQVILIGKPNVGKSTLFNRFSGMKISIAHQTSGATRDLVMRDVNLLGHNINLVDSGGLENEENPFNDLVSQRVKEFVNEKANLVLFLLSAKDGINEQDEEIAKMLRKAQKPVILVINKIDSENNEWLSAESFKFGFKNYSLISAAQNTGIDLLQELMINQLNLSKNSLDTIKTDLHLIEEKDNFSKAVKIAVLGKPNSGKSTFVNTILNEERILTSDISGTTLDAIDTQLIYAGKNITLIDTAGIRRQRSIEEEIEKMAVARSLCALDRASVSLLMIDAKVGITEQDKKIAGIILEKKKACVIVVNKWDEEISSEQKKSDFTEKIRFNFPFFSFAPICFISAKYKHKVFDVLEHAIRLSLRFNKKINTSKLNRSLERATMAHKAPVVLGKQIKFYFMSQIDTAPPTFSISCNMPKKLHFSYERFLANFFRKDLNLDEIPLRLIFKEKSKEKSV